ncbi:MAG: ester cyclase, partial [Myxococcota bacterium]|nr:ester cyclase [Myxococcota bacterium]
VTASASAAPPPVDTPPAPAKPTLAELMPQSLKGIGEAFNAHDAKKLASYYAEDCTIQGYGEPAGRGRDAVAKGLQGMFETFPDAKSVPTRVWMKGNVAVVEMAWSGTMGGDFMGTKATKKAVGQLRSHVVMFNDDGLVKEEHQYGDDAGLMAQMKGAKGAPPIQVLPTNPPAMHVANGTPDEDKLADWAKGIDSVFSKDDPKEAAGTMADDADFWLNFSGMPAVKGKKELTKELTAWFKAFPDQKWSVTNAWGIDGFAIVEHTLSGTQRGPLGPLPASNKPVSDWHWLDILQPSADGKVMHDWAYANVVEMMMQTGAMKAPVEKPSTPGAASKPMASTKAAPATNAAPTTNAAPATKTAAASSAPTKATPAGSATTPAAKAAPASSSK